MLVIRDATGAVINIGAWDAGLVEVPHPDLPDGFTADVEPLDDGSYGVVWRNEGREVIAPLTIETNPLPPGATQGEEDVVAGWDGGLYVAGDPRAVRS